MSYSVTAIQAIPANFAVPGTENANGVFNLLKPVKPGSDQDDKDSLSATDTVKLSTQDRFKTLSASSGEIPHAIGILPVRVPGVVEPIDTVTLSTIDHVRLLRAQGQRDSEIAAALNLPLKEVQSDLHLDPSVHFTFTVAPVASALAAIAPAPAQASASTER